MSAQTATRELLRAIRRIAPARRRWVGACVLVSYVIGTIGLPAPLAGAAKGCQHGTGGALACCCTAASILAGACCCHQPAAKPSCCQPKSAAPSVSTVLRASSSATSGHSCCSKSTQSRSERDGESQDSEIRVSGCPCGPGAPDASLVCADPRLAPEPTVVSGAVRVEAGQQIQSMLAPTGTLEPQTPPPRATV